MDPLADHPNQVSLTPYNFTWNNPVNLTDPDGRCPSCPQGEEAAELYADGAQVENQDGSWTWTGSEWTENTPTRSEIWKDTFGDNTPSDAVSISVGGDLGVALGFGTGLEVVKINRGKDKGWHLYRNMNANIGVAAGVDVFSISSIRLNKDNRLDQTELTAADIQGLGNNYSVSYGVVGVGRGFTTVDNNWTAYSQSENILYTTSSFSLGVGVKGGPAGGAIWQGTYSKLLKSF